MRGFPSLLLAEPWAGLTACGCSGPLDTRGSSYTPAGLRVASGLPGALQCSEFCSGTQACIFPSLGVLMLGRQSPEMEG